MFMALAIVESSLLHVNASLETYSSFELTFSVKVISESDLPEF